MHATSIRTSYQSSHENLRSHFVKVEFRECPVETSLGILGRKWTMAILRDIGAYAVDRFSGLRRSLPGIPSKVLATRLKQLEQEGYLQKLVERNTPPRTVRWSLTEKGVDAMRVAMVLGAFGSKWHADRVFDDGRPRGMSEVYSRAGLELFEKILRWEPPGPFAPTT